MDTIRISKILKEFNIGITTLVEFLKKKGIVADANANGKVSEAAYNMISAEFGKEHDIKEASKKINLKPAVTKVSVADISKKEHAEKPDEKEFFIKSATVPIAGPKIVGKLSDEQISGKTQQPKTKEHPEVKEQKPEIKEVAKEEKPAPKEKPAEPEKPVKQQQDEPAAPKPPKPETQAAKPEVQTPKQEAQTPKPEAQTAKNEISLKSKVELKMPNIIDKIDLDADARKKNDNRNRDRNRDRDRRKDGKQQQPRQNQSQNQNQQSRQNQNQNQPSQHNKPRPAGEHRAKQPQQQQPKSKDSREREVVARVVPEHIKTKVEQLAGPNVVGRIDLNQFNRKPDASRDKDANKDANKDRDKDKNNRGKRQRIRKADKINVADAIKARESKYKNAGKRPDFKKDNANKGAAVNKPRDNKVPDNRNRRPPFRKVDEDEVQRQVKVTLARLTAGKGQKTKSSKYRREKRDAYSQKAMEQKEQQKIESNTLKVTEFVTVNELAVMMNIPVTKVIAACMNLGLMVSINQRLDAEALVLVAEEFGYSVEFVTADLQDSIEEEIDKDEDLLPRPPIITVMGHVDHGKTSLLDNIRKTNVIAGEAGGITQHIGAYSVQLEGGQHITFLDTPGHEAFTAMRARGAKITDVAIIIVAADDAVMPQTVEAINHATAAGVPMIFAINKIDKPGANPEKIREQLANMNYLTEEWGGKYQSQEIAAKQGVNVERLLEKVLLEAEMLDLKANPNKKATGTVIESSLDKGRGYVTTLLVQSGTLNLGDTVLSGTYTGRVKAMFDERGNRIEKAGPSTPVLMLGLNGAPAAGETFNVMNDDKEAREIANKREQLLRIQDIRTRKHITLEEIGRRIAIGSFKELNVVVKTDVDGSMEALADSLIKLSTEEVQVNIIHKAVGAISESDVLLAAASNAIVIGFQVRPAAGARKLAEREEIEIRLYSVIYDAINEIRDGIEGMLAPEVKEEITSTVEVLEIFKIAKVGTVAGCIVREGKITRSSKIRVIRDGIVIYTGYLGSLKRFKDDVKEVLSGYECGLNVDNFNDIKTGDNIESYEEVEIKRKL